MVGYGTVVPQGSLPVYSVATEQEARRLLTACCATNVDGEWVAEELVEARTLDSLYAFGRRLKLSHERLQQGLPPVPPERTKKLCSLLS